MYLEQCSDLNSAASLLATVGKVGRAAIQDDFNTPTPPPPPSSPNGGRRWSKRRPRLLKLGQDKRSVLPLQVERWECSASGHPGPWGPAGLRSVPSFLQDTVGAEFHFTDSEWVFYVEPKGNDHTLVIFNPQNMLKVCN